MVHAEASADTFLLLIIIVIIISPMTRVCSGVKGGSSSFRFYKWVVSQSGSKGSFKSAFVVLVWAECQSVSLKYGSCHLQKKTRGGETIKASLRVQHKSFICYLTKLLLWDLSFCVNYFSTLVVIMVHSTWYKALSSQSEVRKNYLQEPYEHCRHE